MEQNYEVAIREEVGNRQRLRRRTHENVDAIILKRQEIIKGFAIKNPRETLTTAVSEAEKSIIDTLTNAGIPISGRDIPEVLFIDWKDKGKLEDQLKPFGGEDFGNKTAGGFSVFNGVTVVFLGQGGTELDYARTIFHEMFHSVGKQIVVANEEKVYRGRVGLDLLGMGSHYKPWVIEEGVTTYEAAEFMNSLSKKPLFQQDAKRRLQLLEGLRKTKDGKIKLPKEREIDSKYYRSISLAVAVLQESDNKIVRVAVEIIELILSAVGVTAQGYDSFTGSLFELLLSRYEGGEQKEFLNLVHRARRNLRLISKLAKMIDSKWGKGTYSRLLKCERSEEAVWDIISDLRSRKD